MNDPMPDTPIHPLYVLEEDTLLFHADVMDTSQRHTSSASVRETLSTLMAVAYFIERLPGALNAPQGIPFRDAITQDVIRYRESLTTVSPTLADGMALAVFERLIARSDKNRATEDPALLPASSVCATGGGHSPT